MTGLARESAAALAVLHVATPPGWVRRAAADWQTLLVDHANCEKKAASTALALMFAYPDDTRLTLALARLAREELRHFEQVQKLMQRLGVPMQRLAPGRYATGLRSRLASGEPARKRDLLLTGALIEARSCERFEALVPHLAEPLADFYRGLAESERRHAGLYLELALQEAGDEAGREAVRGRLHELAQYEAQLVRDPDPLFRFHSGDPGDCNS